MDNQELKSNIERIEQELASMKEHLREQESLLWKPELGEGFWTPNAFGNAFYDKFEDDAIDNSHWNHGEFFKSKEEAKNHTRKQRVFNLLMQLSDVDAKNYAVYTYYPYVDLGDKEVCINYNSYNAPTPYGFSTREKCQEAIDYIGEKEVYFFLTGKEME